MKKNNKKGFTLVELVIVVAVMAILVAVAIPTVKSITTSATDAVEKTNCRTIESVIKMYAATQSNTDNSYVITANGAVAACNDADLGIEKDNYYYIVDTGAVVASKPATGSAATGDSAPAAGSYIILGFSAAGACSGTEYTASAS